MNPDHQQAKRQRYRKNRANRNAIKRANLLNITFKTGSGNIWINGIECNDQGMNGLIYKQIVIK